MISKQREFSAENTATYEAGVAVRTTETVGYITDLLGELETIATLSGLTHLSNDIHSVLAKHKIEVFKG